jgi:hypothetical protein
MGIDKIVDKKKCCSCKIEYPYNANFFHRDRYAKTGLKSVCKKCAIIQQHDWSNKNRERVRKFHKINRYKRIDEGLCCSCREKRLENSNIFCEKHWYMGVAIRNLKNRNLWKDIRALAFKQNFKCAYTDRSLIPGVNMSLDHIDSIKMNPEKSKDINNVQWVALDINRIKNGLTHEEFLGFCKDVYLKFFKE